MPATPAYDMSNGEPSFRYNNNDNDMEGVVYRDVTHTEGATGYSYSRELGKQQVCPSAPQLDKPHGHPTENGKKRSKNKNNLRVRIPDTKVEISDIAEDSEGEHEGTPLTATTGDHPSLPPVTARRPRRSCRNNRAFARSDSLMEWWKNNKGNGRKWWWAKLKKAIFISFFVCSLLANAVFVTLYIKGHSDRPKLHGHVTNKPVLTQPTPAPITQAPPPPQNQETGKCGCLDNQIHTFTAIKAQVDKLATKQANNTIVYYKQSTDTKLQGVRYDSSSGRFIIDTQGYYRISSQISVDIRSGNVNNFNHCIMRNSEELICARHRHGDDWAGPSHAVEPLVELKSGESISVKLNTIDFIYNENHSQITIYKLGCS